MDSQTAEILRRDTSTIPISALRYADSPRLQGEDAEHIRTLAESGPLPPILVHRSTMRVIDGMHRLQAAILNGREEIEVRYFDGGEHDAFVAGVQANTAHGLPLSRADREAATERILASHPQWSDRAIAEVAGLAATTVARIRERSPDENVRQQTRIGRDGRSRPVNGAAGRRLAGELLTTLPDASLRQVARIAGISPATAKDVRDRMLRGDDPVPARLTLAERRGEDHRPEDKPKAPLSGRLRPQPPETGLVLRKLQRDPSLRMNDQGRLLLRWLTSRSLNSAEWAGFEGGIPEHCVPLVADLALGVAEEWMQFADALRRREQTA